MDEMEEWDKFESKDNRYHSGRTAEMRAQNHNPSWNKVSYTFKPSIEYLKVRNRVERWYFTFFRSKGRAPSQKEIDAIRF